MTLKSLALGLILLATTAVCWAGSFTGPSGALFLTDSTNSTIYVVQGNSVVASFPEAYAGSFSESVIAVTAGNGIATRTYYTGDSSGGGQYTLGGTPTGVLYGDPLPAGVTSDFAWDGTSNGVNNFFVEDFGVTGTGSHTETVYATGLDWSNPVALFSVQTIPGTSVGEYRGISYDPLNNSLWLGGWDDEIIADYSLSGTLLSSFVPQSFENGALAFDPSDGTIWVAAGGSNLLDQYSTTGTLLQSGTPIGLPAGTILGGEFIEATPEPATWTAMFSGLVALAGLRRKPR